MAEILARVLAGEQQGRAGDGGEERDEVKAGRLLREGLQRDRRAWRIRALKYLRARGRDVGKASEALRENVLWRDKWSADALFDEGPRVIHNFERMLGYWPTGHMGVDRRGLPLLIDRMGDLDIETLKLCPMADVVHMHIWFQERQWRSSRDAFEAIERAEAARLQGLPESAGEEERATFVDLREDAIPTLTVTTVEDLGQLGMKHMASWAMSMLKQFIEIDEAHYVESLEKLLIVNAPSMFTVMWAVVRPWVDPVTITKIAIYGTNCGPALLQELDADQIPVRLGGALDRPYPGGPGGKFPIENPDGTTFVPISAKIARRSSLEVPLSPSSSPSRLRWRVSVASHDVAFSILCPASSPLLPARKISSSQEDAGELLLDAPGRYTVVFDNSYSALRGKSLTFQFSFDHPQQQQPLSTAAASS
ncbi:MAG: SEC14 family lipid-binding protein [archaeon]|nr:SEC14 family lipid-binding protein [archaeon]